MLDHKVWASRIVASLKRFSPSGKYRPDNDTPERLNAYSEQYGGDWHFLTGETSELERVWEEFRMYVKKGAVSVDHTTITYILDRQGVVRLRYGGLPPPTGILADLENLGAGQDS